MASTLRTMKRGSLGAPEKRFFTGPHNNRKSTRGRRIQVDPATGRKILHTV